MSATLGALVIAIATEFSVLLSARYHEERSRGGTIGEALRRAYARTGTAVLASGVTAIAGFAVLVFTDIRMLRDFGLVTVFDLGGRAARRAAGAAGGPGLVGGRVRSPGGARGAAAPPRPPGRRRCRLRTTRAAAQGPGRRYSTFVGLAFLVLIVVATLNTLRTQGGGILGISAGERGMPLPEFAVPNAVTGPLDKRREHRPGRLLDLGEPVPVGREAPARLRDPRHRGRSGSATSSTGRWCSRSGSRGARTACRPRTSLECGLAARYRGRVNFLSIDVRDDPSRRPEHRLPSTAGRCRSATTATAP